MQNLNIKATPKSFEVNCENGFIEIKGCSIINDPKIFFKPLQTWITEYFMGSPADTIVSLKIDYIDSASTKFIFEILKSFEVLINQQKSVMVLWYYDVNDPEILEIGEILAGRLQVPFNFILY